MKMQHRALLAVLQRLVLVGITEQRQKGAIDAGGRLDHVGDDVLLALLLEVAELLTGELDVLAQIKAPRFVAATAWISSTITVSTPASVSRAALVSMRKRDSGVVIKMSGGSRSSSRRSAEVVSPERTPTVMAGTGIPSRFAVWVMPTRGERRLRSTSTPSAFSGEM